MFKKMRISLLVLLFTTYSYSFGVKESDDLLTKLIRGNGYPLEVHEIETEDGYLLNLYRIPHGRYPSQNRTANRSPVLLNHGLGGSAENFVWIGSSRSIALLLADDGYDVWMLCSRGTWHSTKHKTLKPDKDLAYWQFTWHEIGVYDTPASIDYILQRTGEKNLHYVGHSQGTTSMFAMASDRPEYNDKIKVMVALAPSALLHEIKHPIRLVIPIYEILRALTNALLIYKIPPYISTSTFIAVFREFCRFTPNFICKYILFSVAGIEQEQFIEELSGIFTSAFPAGLSVHQLYHYAQVVKSHEFGRYDWGEALNLEKYGSKIPGRYQIEKATFPVALYYGEKDLFISLKDIESYKQVLPNIVQSYMVPYEDWTDNDYIWARDIKTLLNNDVLRVMGKFK
ncbi:unnamed protein product [Phaedon cochleariae]|uniref:Lipase n=1 Tax=Phaedon cochleariae TaxID=80249 RepID=A0A9P0DYP5_PHACE|nr:unnamed protein product [Phaedon cochleariae]